MKPYAFGIKEFNGDVCFHVEATVRELRLSRLRLRLEKNEKIPPTLY